MCEGRSERSGDRGDDIYTDFHVLQRKDKLTNIGVNNLFYSESQSSFTELLFCIGEASSPGGERDIDFSGGGGGELHRWNATVAAEPFPLTSLLLIMCV